MLCALLWLLLPLPPPSVALAQQVSYANAGTVDVEEAGDLDDVVDGRVAEPGGPERLHVLAGHGLGRARELDGLLLRQAAHERRIARRGTELEAAGNKVEAVAIGNKGFGFLNRIGAKVVSHVTQLGDTPHLDRLIGPVKVLLDQYAEGKLNAVYLSYTKLINTMRQEPVVEQLLPLSAAQMEAQSKASGGHEHGWDYIYEPDAKTVIDELLLRYVEALVYQAVAENMASEQSARMVAMKAATDNAGNVIAELKLVYNKTRQAAITKELSEIVAGAAAV